jgi:hypothetical protein
MSEDKTESLELFAEEKRVLIRLLQQTVEDARFLYVPSLAPLKAILAKLEPPAPLNERPPPLRPGLGPTHGQGRRRR